MSDLITDFIDEKAFAQFERLHENLKQSQESFAKVVASASELNSELTKAKGMDELIFKMSEFSATTKKVIESEKEQKKTHEELKESQKQLVDGIVSRIEASKNIEPTTKKTNNALEQQVKVQVELKMQMKALRDEQKTLNTAVKDGSVSKEMASQIATKLAVEENLLKQAIQESNKEIKDKIKSDQLAEGSSAQLSMQLDTLRAQYRALSQEERENINIGGAMLTNIQSLDSKMKELDSSQGVHTRNVGNYKIATDGLNGAISSIIPSFGSLTASYNTGVSVLGSLTNVVMDYVNGTEVQTTVQNTNTTATNAGTIATKSSAVALNTTSKALKLFRIALVSTGIGAIVVVLGSLIAYLTGTQEGMDMVTKVTKPLKAIFQSLLGVFQNVGKAIMSAFTNPKKAIIDIYDFVKGKVIKTFKALYDIVVGIATLDFKQAKSGFKALTEDAVATAKATAKFFGDAAAEGARMDKIAKEIQKDEKELVVLRGQLNRLIDEEREKSRDTSLTSKERAVAAQNALDAINKLAEKETTLQDKRIALLKAEQDLSGNMHDDNMEMANLIAKRDEIAGAAAKQRIKINATLLAINKETAKEQADAMKKQAEKQAEINRKRTENEKSAQKRILDLAYLRMSVDEKQLSKEAENYKKTAENENESFETRLKNISLYEYKRTEAIETGIAIERKKIEESLTEVAELRKQGKIKEANTLDKIMEISIKENVEKEKELKEQLQAEIAKSQLDIIKANISEEGKAKISALQENNAKELTEIELLFARGQMSNNEYQRAKYQTNQKYADLILKLEIETIQKIIDAQKAKGGNLKKEEEQLAKLRIQQSKNASDAEIKDLNRVKDEQAKVTEVRKQIQQELATLAISLVNGMFEAETQRLEAELENLSRKTELEKLAVEQKVLGEEDKRAKLAEIDERAAIERMALEDKQRKVKEKQAKFNRAVDIMQIISNTAVGVTAALGTLNIPLSVAIGALGALQLATLLATPIPKYYTGTDSSKEGLAHVGERGTELGITPDGSVFLTPNKDTLAYLEGGTQIFDAAKTRDILRNGVSLDVPRFEKYEVNMSELIRSGKQNTMDLKKAFSSRPEQKTILTKRGLLNTYKNGSKWYNYKNNLIN